MNLILFAMFAHLALVILLYVLLTIMRAPSVWGIGKNADGSNPFLAFEKRVSANLSNQFEFPLFFYVISVLVLAYGFVDNALFNGLAWVFVLGRIIHSLVQILTTNIRLRGLIFTINFVAVIAMWILFLVKMYAKI